jgi:hypothetical protein
MEKEIENQDIEEMAAVIGSAIEFDELDFGMDEKTEIIAKKAAEKFYAEGYRKQSEGDWKQTEEPMGWHDVDCVECSVCGESWVLNDNLDFDLIVEYWHYCPNCGASMTRGKTNE